MMNFIKNQRVFKKTNEEEPTEFNETIRMFTVLLMILIGSFYVYSITHAVIFETEKFEPTTQEQKAETTEPIAMKIEIPDEQQQG